MRLTILGSGDAFSSGGRMPSCYFLESGGVRFLVDFGPASLVAMKRLGLSTAAPQFVFISHLHGDHIGGLPFFHLDTIFVSRRTEPLVMIGPPGLESRFRLACEVFYPRWNHMTPGFELRFIELQEGVRRQIEGGPLVQPFLVDHFSGSPSYALRFELDGKVFAFSGDAAWSDNVIAAGRNADLYLLECYQYDRQLPMHLDYATISRHFDDIGAKKLVLTHMSEQMLENQAHVDLGRCTLAEDGLVIDF
jgi:ribonuclease BN (tRNA processing enzyme)